ncbi:ATP-binding protein [Flavobacterium ovatum]|uniref:ATP-binding protein n=1 Tax=Flavobacterium ovatum TaxID=1928857 RepID=UPI00344FE41A
MDAQQKLRIKSAMIIYELELALGNYVLDNEVLDNISEESKTTIIDREKRKGNEISKDNINLIVESSYLDEIFNFAIDSTQGISINKHITDLKLLCSILGVFDIRNAISHPNRPFPDCYWFRAATIASDPLIDKVGLNSVRQALNFAVEENLNMPPEDWISNVSWAIPNTLPHSFDHEITGLLGREKEFKDLDSVLSKVRNNLIAIVAPGGIGKTALILQFLKDLSLSPNWSNKISSILFCTLKNERLTANGIEIIEAINGIEQIKESILEDLKKLYNQKELNDFEDACNKLQDEKILICIDNLETLLVHSQTEFIEFNESLPLLWRVMVTSRISIDSATTVPIEPLVKRHAVNLSRNYLRKRGVNDFKLEDLEKIADAANNNPLAIRLTIDLYNKGIDISQSIQKSQKDIASFSYKNLIESLSNHSISILEAIYVISDSTKSELIDFLDLSNEEITQSINELSKTSLIIRRTEEFGNDSYKLSESIRDLLLINPKNIEIRNQISESLKKRKEKIIEQTKKNQQLGVSEFDDEFVSTETDSTVHGLIVDLNKFLAIHPSNRNHNDLIELKTRFVDSIRYRANDIQLLYHYSRILKQLKDTTGELEILNNAEKINSESPRIKMAIALHHFYKSDYDEALKVFEYLLSKKYDDPLISSNKFSYSITKLYFLSLLYLGKYDKIITITENWENSPIWKVMYGVYRASALKRSVEFSRLSDKDTESTILKSIEIFENIFNTENYQDVACIESNKLIKEIEILLSKKTFSENFISSWVKFISNHYFNILSRLKNESISSLENQKFLERIYNLKLNPNPLHSVKWYVNQTETTYDSEHIEELIQKGFIIVQVYHIPDDRGFGISNFLFAEDNEKNQFFLSVYNFDQGWNRWGFIELNSKLAIKYTKLQLNGKPTPAEEIVEIEQY